MPDNDNLIKTNLKKIPKSGVIENLKNIANTLHYT